MCYSQMTAVSFFHLNTPLNIQEQISTGPFINYSELCIPWSLVCFHCERTYVETELFTFALMMSLVLMSQYSSWCEYCGNRKC